jgi:hypothetical protein
MSCATMPTRVEQESEMLTLLNKMAPLAHEIIEIDKIPQTALEKAKANDREGVKQVQKDYIGNMYRKQNLSAELQPYQQRFNSYKYRYIQNFGTIEYNEFIKKNNFTWGLGIYW